MPVELRAILPRRAAVPPAQQIRRGIDRFLRDFAFGVVREMQEYPPARPWKHRPPSSGPRKGGRRTGFYGREWGVGVRFGANRVEVVNRAVYAVYVGGPVPGRGPGRRQAHALRARGWKSVSDVAPVLRRRFRPLLLEYLRGSRG